MLYAGTYVPIADREPGSLSEAFIIFNQWTPPEGFTFVAHYARASGMGGLFVADVTSNAALLEATTVFAGYYDIDVWPVVDMAEAMPVIQRAQEWVGERLNELDDEYEDDEEE